MSAREARSGSSRDFFFERRERWGVWVEGFEGDGEGEEVDGEWVREATRMFL